VNRWYQTELWHELFDMLLNTGGGLGAVDLAHIRNKFETYLMQTPAARAELRTLLRKQAIMIFDMRHSHKRS
jgi:hypothetical protein